MITPKGLNDLGFNDMAFAGLKSAASKFPVEPIVIEPSTMKDHEESLRFFAGQKFDAIIAVGVAFIDSIKKISSEFPDLKFFVIDSNVNEEKIKGIYFREDEGSFLCGVIAAYISKTRKVGFVGGVKIPVILRFLEGFKHGVNYVASDVVIVEKFLAEDFSGFNKPEVAKEVALDLYKNDCDIIFHAAGASGLGVISVAVDLKKFVFGVDMNQDSMAPGLVLTSLLKRVDLVVEDLIKSLAEGKSTESIKRSYGIADGAINITDFQFTREVVGEELIRKVEGLKKKISDGSLVTGVASPTP